MACRSTLSLCSESNFLNHDYQSYISPLCSELSTVLSIPGKKGNGWGRGEGERDKAKFKSHKLAINYFKEVQHKWRTQ